MPTLKLRGQWEKNSLKSLSLWCYPNQDNLAILIFYLIIIIIIFFAVHTFSDHCWTAQGTHFQYLALGAEWGILPHAYIFNASWDTYNNMLKAMLCVLYYPRSNLCCKLRSSALNKLTRESRHIRDLATSHYLPPGGGGGGGGRGFGAKRAVI